MLRIFRRKLIKWQRIVFISVLIAILFLSWLPTGIKKPDSIKDFLKPPEAEARYQWDPSGGSIVTGSDFPVQDALANTPSYRALFSDDSWHWVTKFDSASGLDKRANIDGVRLQGANKMSITYGGYVSDAAGTYFLQIYDNVNTTWRNLNWRDVSLANTSDANYAYEIYNGYWQSGGSPIDTPLSNFVTTDSNKRVQIRVYSTVTGRAILHYWDRLNIEIAIDSLVYARSLTRLNGWTGTITNNYTWTNYADNSRLIATNQSATPLDFYLSFQNVQTYPGANTIFVHHQGSASNAALTHRLQIYNFNTPGWEDLNATLLSNTTETDYYFAKNNVDLTNYVSSNEVRIRYYTTTLNTYTLSIDLVYITIGSTNNDTAQCQVSFGTEAGGTTCANARTIDTSSADSTWQQTTDKTAAAGFYPGDYAGTWNTNYSASANLWAPITIPNNSAVIAVKYVARFRSNSTANTMMPCLKDMSGLNPTVLGTGYAATGGWVDVSVSNALTTYTVLDPYTYTHYTSPEDFIDTLNNRANIRMRTSASTATASVTRDWDFAMVSIKWLQDDTSAANNPQYVRTSGSLQVGTAVAVGATNPASSTATFASDNYYWQNQNLTSGTDRLDIRINIDGVNLNNANKMIITYEGLVSNAALTYQVQIYDNINTTWRNLTDREVALSSTTEASYYFSIFNGFWNSGNDPIDTPLSNFITADSDKRVQIRIYSSTAIGTAYAHSLDRILLEVVTSPVYWAKDFTRITGTGTITNTYKFTHPAATLAATTGGDDDAELSVANISGESFDYYFTFGNIQTYTGANAILIYQESRSSVATLTYRLKIYNFTTPGWEDLTTTNINVTAADTVYQFAKAPVNLSDYISGNELRIGYYTSATVSGTHYVDYIYVTIGAVISDTGDVELSFGSSNGSSVLNTQDLDATLASPNVYGINTASTATSHYANDYTPGLYNIAQAGAANIIFRAAVPNGAFITGYRFAARYRSNSTFMTVRSGTFDYAGLTGTTGGWYETGTTNALTTYTYTEGWHHATDNNVEDFTANYQKKFNMRLRTTASTLDDQATIGLDFIFISVRWAGSPNLLQNYYRWYVNEDNITPADPWPVGGTNLGENTAIGVSDSPPGVGSVLRLRMSLVVQGQDLGASSKDFKLQYATSTNCVSVPWDQWSDVVTVASCSGPDPWCGSDNSTPNDGDTLLSTKLSVSDVAETYEESNPSALNPNSATIGQDIEYDWVIKNNNAPIETSYCFRMAKSDGDPLSAYNNYPKLVTGVTTINLTLSTPTVGLGILTPGTANTATSTATVTVSGATVGYNLQVQRNDATSTLDLSTDGTIDFLDYTAWDSTGNGNATTTPGSTFSFRVQQTGTNSNYSTTWWGANDDNGTAKYAGFPSPSSSQTIMNCDAGGTCNNGTTTSVILYRLDAPIIQQVGSYDGDITFTALVNP